MKASTLIKLLQQGIKDHGDVDVALRNSEDGTWDSITMLVKSYPYVWGQPCDRTKPVQLLGVLSTDSKFYSADLIVTLPTKRK